MSPSSMLFKENDQSEILIMLELVRDARRLVRKAQNSENTAFSINNVKFELMDKF